MKTKDASFLFSNIFSNYFVCGKKNVKKKLYLFLGSVVIPKCYTANETINVG